MRTTIEPDIPTLATPPELESAFESLNGSPEEISPFATVPAPSAESDAVNLRQALEPFARESRMRSWFHVISTYAVLALLLVLAAWLPQWWGRAAAAIIGGLVMVRAFILFHDYCHGALLRGSKVAGWLFAVSGMLVLTPARFWKYSHNYHHANVGKPIKPGSREGAMPALLSDIGTFPMMTTDQWSAASARHRFYYRLSRHPLTMMSAAITVFGFSLCLQPFLRNPRKYADGGVAVLVFASLVTTLCLVGGFALAWFAFLMPFLIAAAAGAYLFYVQHNYPGARLEDDHHKWEFQTAALESSGYLKLGRTGRWFTGNIGYHHVHHLNSRIPFYRLPEAMAAVPALQDPPVTTLSLRDIRTCLSLQLWCPEREKLVTFREARATAS